MGDVPEFYGIRRSNMRDLDLWSREMFPNAFSVALMNYMGDRGLPLNYVVTDSSLKCSVRTIGTREIYGGQVSDEMEFWFGSIYDPYTEMAVGVPESALVLRDGRGMPSGRVEILSSVVPDASTRMQSDDLMGPEVCIRTPLLEHLALSIASSLRNDAEVVSELEEGIPLDQDWSNWDNTSILIPQILDNLDRLESRFTDSQRPVMVQVVWKSEDGGPFMSDDAMDAFAWSDFALTRLFLESARRPAGHTATRPQRAAVRLYLIISSMLRGESPCLDDIVAETGYGLPEGKEFLANGRMTNRLMACERLTKPAVSALDVTFLGTHGFESMIMPERRLDMSVYYAVRALKG